MDGETDDKTLSIAAHGSIAAIGREAWDACAKPFGNPFLSYDFLEACETSGCATPQQGWAPRHLAVSDAAGRVRGVMPLYLKAHSQGEYVFDHGWAEAYERAGGRYYPKLLSGVPFTPVTGPRLLSAKPEVRALLAAGAVALTDQLGASSLHVNFPLEREQAAMTEAGLLPRQDVQYWWENEGWADFDAFLAALSSSRRKTIRRERREAQAGVEIVTLTGAEITDEHWDAFFAFYMDTGARKWGRPYLNRLFFALVGERMAERIALVMARKDGRWIAGALNFIGADALYGRQWGALEHIPFLHFELCYYRAIDFALERGLGRVEAGAQGEHKMARGYRPRPVYSAHYIADARLRAAVKEYLDRERPAVIAEMGVLEAEYSPYRRGPPG